MFAEIKKKSRGLLFIQQIIKSVVGQGSEPDIPNPPRDSTL